MYICYKVLTSRVVGLTCAEKFTCYRNWYVRYTGSACTNSCMACITCLVLSDISRVREDWIIKGFAVNVVYRNDQITDDFWRNLIKILTTYGRQKFETRQNRDHRDPLVSPNRINVLTRHAKKKLVSNENYYSPNFL